MSRQARVYRLDITYPPGSDQPGWRPQSWTPIPWDDYDPYDGGPDPNEFRWPRERDFLSPSGAAHRKQLLEGWGCAVTVRLSDPVTWPGTVTS